MKGHNINTSKRVSSPRNSGSLVFGHGWLIQHYVLSNRKTSQVGHFDNPWLIFSKYIDAVNENCVNNMLPKWEDRLGGAQQFMSTHCFIMTESGRVDSTVQALLQKNG